MGLTTLVLRMSSDGGKERGLRGEFLAHVDLTPHFPDDRFTTQHVHDNAQLIARHDRTAKSGFVDSHEIHDSVFYVFGFAMEQSHDCTRLRHRFDREDAWHDGSRGKVPLKERFVE